MKTVQAFMQYVQRQLSNDERQLCEPELTRAHREINWLMALDEFYEDFIEYFIGYSYKDNGLCPQEVIAPNFKGCNPGLEHYFMELCTQMPWVELSQADVLAFLEGGDFDYLSDRAYYFMLPACIKLCIDLFRLQGDFDTPMQILGFFLNDNARANAADTKTKRLVFEFIKLASNDSYFVLGFGTYTLDKLLAIWQVDECLK